MKLSHYPMMGIERPLNRLPPHYVIQSDSIKCSTPAMVLIAPTSLSLGKRTPYIPPIRFSAGTRT